MLLRAAVIFLLFSLFFFSCSHPYLFISDPVFAELEISRINGISSSPIEFEVFSRKPSPEELVAAVRKRGAAALVLSPLYHDLAQRVLDEAPGLPVYAPAPSGYPELPGITIAEVDALGAADAIIALLEEKYPEKRPVYLTVLQFSEDSRWNSMIQRLTGAEGHFLVKQAAISLDMVKQRNFGSMMDTKTDVLLLLLGEYSAEIGENPATDVRGVLPELLICDRPVDSGGKFDTFTLSVDWRKVYRALLKGIEEASPWILVPDDRNEQANPPGVITDFISN